MKARGFARALASGFGLGFAPRAPGTVGSVAGLLAGAALLGWSPLALPLAAVLAAGVGLWAVGACGARDDPGWVVIDEVAGQLVAMLPLTHPGWPGLLLSLALFRLFDIAKPGPVGWIDRRRGPLAVMGDDLAAGGLAALTLPLLRGLSGGALDL